MMSAGANESGLLVCAVLPATRKLRTEMSVLLTIRKLARRLAVQCVNCESCVTTGAALRSPC
jgi:hypothetical protein